MVVRVNDLFEKVASEASRLVKNKTPFISRNPAFGASKMVVSSTKQSASSQVQRRREVWREECRKKDNDDEQEERLMADTVFVNDLFEKVASEALPGELLKHAVS